MKLGDRFCIDDKRGRCLIEAIEGCDNCKSYWTYKECKHCGDNNTYTAIGDDNLCTTCRALEESL